jgi:hypothetical protein
MAKKPDLDDATLQIAERMLRMPPKPHEEMKVGKAKRTPRKPRRQTKRPK